MLYRLSSSISSGGSRLQNATSILIMKSPSNDSREYHIELGVIFANAVEDLFYNGVLGTNVFQVL